MYSTNNKNTVMEEIWWLDVILVEFEMKARNAIRSILKVGGFKKPEVQGKIRIRDADVETTEKTDDIKIETTKMLR